MIQTYQLQRNNLTSHAHDLVNIKHEHGNYGSTAIIAGICGFMVEKVNTMLLFEVSFEY
jgi:hypothetical protein